MIRAMTGFIHRSVPGGQVSVHYGDRLLAATTFFDGCRTPSSPCGQLDLAFHFAALALQWPCSLTLWRAAHQGCAPRSWRMDDEWPYRTEDEAEIVKALLEHLLSGAPQPVLATIWGPRLPRLTAHFSTWLKPWLEPPATKLPLPLHPEEVSFPLAEESEEIPMGRAARSAWS